MRNKDAVTLYLKKNGTAKRIVGRLVRWDQRKTFKYNMRRMGMSRTHARLFARGFGLSFKGSSLRRQKVDLTVIKPRGVDKLRKWGYTYEQIARLHNVSKQRIEQIMTRWRHRKGGF